MSLQYSVAPPWKTNLLQYSVATLKWSTPVHEYRDGGQYQEYRQYRWSTAQPTMTNKEGWQCLIIEIKTNADALDPLYLRPDFSDRQPGRRVRFKTQHAFKTYYVSNLRSSPSNQATKLRLKCDLCLKFQIFRKGDWLRGVRGVRLCELTPPPCFPGRSLCFPAWGGSQIFVQKCWKNIGEINLKKMKSVNLKF